MGKINFITQEGLDSLLKEIEQLETVERPAISRQIGEAIEKGDISENAEYDAAKDAQGMLEAKISKLKSIVAGSRVIDNSLIDTSKVHILNIVTIKNIKTGVAMTYKLVPENEANFKAGKLSINTPIARGLVGKKKGEIAKIQVPSGMIEFEIVDIAI